MKKADFSKIKIDNKKDWIIFWVFAVLVAYAVAGFFMNRIDQVLRKLDSPWLWEGNEPQSYGRMIAAVVLLVLMAEVICFLRRKKLWTKLAVLAAGILIPAALVWMYWYNCRLIVSVLWDEKPSYIGVTWEDPGSNKNIRYHPTPEEQADILEMCRNLTVVSDERILKEFKEWEMQIDSIWKQDGIDLHFPEKYGHNYYLNIYVWGDYVYFFRGHGYGNAEFFTLFEDNGLIQYIENIKQEQIGAAQ